MNHTQKKCLIASTVAHALLLVIVFFGAAFLPKPEEKISLPTIDFIPDKVVDDLMFGGGNPNVTEAPAPAAATPPPAAAVQPQVVAPPPTQPVTPPPDPTPPPPKPVVKDPPKETTKEAVVEKKPTPKDDEPAPEKTKKRVKNDEPKPVKPEPRQTQVQVNTKIKSRTVDTGETKRKQEQAEAEERARQAADAVKAANAARQAQFNKALSSLSKGLSGSTQIETPGPGGAAYANYEQLVKSIYEGAWIAPDDVTDDSLVVRVRVTIRKDGNVVAGQTYIESASGNRTLDNSIKRVLERVKFVHEFPEGAKDEQRVFRINFNLKTKRQLG